MIDDVLFEKLMRYLSLGFPVVLCLLILVLISSVNQLGAEIKAAPAHMNSRPILPAGVYVCDGESCVIATSENTKR